MPLVNRAGAICVVSGDRTTYPQFAQNVATASTTRGTCLLWQLAGGGGVAGARNELVAEALDRGAGWIWFIDDDHVFTSDVLGRLLKHDQDIVVPTVLTRKPPHGWVGWQTFPVRSDMSDADLVDGWKRHVDRPTIETFPNWGTSCYGEHGSGTSIARRSRRGPRSWNWATRERVEC